MEIRNCKSSNLKSNWGDEHCKRGCATPSLILLKQEQEGSLKCQVLVRSFKSSSLILLSKRKKEGLSVLVGSFTRFLSTTVTSHTRYVCWGRQNLSKILTSMDTSLQSKRFMPFKSKRWLITYGQPLIADKGRSFSQRRWAKKSVIYWTVVRTKKKLSTTLITKFSHFLRYSLEAALDFNTSLYLLCSPLRKSSI